MIFRICSDLGGCHCPGCRQHVGVAIHHSMTHNKAFQIIGDSAGCAVVRLNNASVTVDECVRDASNELCLKLTSLDFLKNLTDGLTTPRDFTLGRMPVAEAAHLGD